MELYERMAPALEGGAGGGPANMGNGDVVRHFDPAYLTRKTQAKDLKNAKVFLQRGLLTAESIEHFSRLYV